MAATYKGFFESFLVNKVFSDEFTEILQVPSSSNYFVPAVFRRNACPVLSASKCHIFKFVITFESY